MSQSHLSEKIKKSIFVVSQLESNPQLPKKKFYQWKPFKNDEKFFFISPLTALFVLELFAFLSWLFVPVEKRAWIER